MENEQSRRDGHTTSLELRRERLQLLRGEDERGVIQQGVVKLKEEIGVLSKALSQAEREEEEARRVSNLLILAYFQISSLSCASMKSLDMFSKI